FGVRVGDSNAQRTSPSTLISVAITGYFFGQPRQRIAYGAASTAVRSIISTPPRPAGQQPERLLSRRTGFSSLPRVSAEGCGAECGSSACLRADDEPCSFTRHARSARGDQRDDAV